MALTDVVQVPTAKDPLDARVVLVGTPGVGKTTLACGWSPRSTLIADTQRGTELVPGVRHRRDVTTWAEFVGLVDSIASGDRELAGGDRLRTLVIDLVDELWDYCDRHHAGKNAVLASATDDWQRSIKTAEGIWRQEIGRLFDTELGIWFLSHAREKQVDGVQRFVSNLAERPAAYVFGGCQYVFLAETLGPKRRLHTQPTARFEAKSRAIGTPMPEPMDLDARALYAAMHAALNPKPQPRETKAA